MLLPLSRAAREMGIQPDTLRRSCARGEIAYSVRAGRYYLPSEIVKKLTVGSIIPPKAREITPRPKGGLTMGAKIDKTVPPITVNVREWVKENAPEWLEREV